jgi:hypothetical protein
MWIRQTVLVAALAALFLPGCGRRSPTELSGPDRFSLDVTLRNASGQSTLGWVQLSVDNVVEDDSCPAPNIVTEPSGRSCDFVDLSIVLLSAEDRIAPGPHILRISILQQPSSESYRYTVDAFTMEVRDGSGQLLKNIDFPALSDRLTAGQAFYYNFTI